jgi:hypothetical protein
MSIAQRGLNARVAHVFADAGEVDAFSWCVVMWAVKNERGKSALVISFDLGNNFAPMRL